MLFFFFVSLPNGLTKMKIAILILKDFQGEIQFKINISVRAGHEILVLCYFHSSTSSWHCKHTHSLRLELGMINCN